MTDQAILLASKILGSQAELARRMGVTRGYVGQLVSGLRTVPAEHCPAIERATNGQVRCEDLRPDVDWAVLRCQCQRDEAAHDERGPSEHEMQEAA